MTEAERVLRAQIKVLERRLKKYEDYTAELSEKLEDRENRIDQLKERLLLNGL